MHRYIDDELTSFESASDELRRVDHLIYVSLKYTRTVDVIKNILARMIACFDHLITGILKMAEDERRIFEIPVAPGAKVVSLKKLYPDSEEIAEMLRFFSHLRKLHGAEYVATREFRRNVNMCAKMRDGTTEDVNIDVISDYYIKCKEILFSIRPFFKG